MELKSSSLGARGLYNSRSSEKFRSKQMAQPMGPYSVGMATGPAPEQVPLSNSGKTGMYLRYTPASLPRRSTSPRTL